MVVFYVTNIISHVGSAAIGNLFDTIFRKVMITKESYETILNLLKVFLDQFRFRGFQQGPEILNPMSGTFWHVEIQCRVCSVSIFERRVRDIKIILTRGNQSFRMIVSESNTVPWISDD